MPQHPDIEAQLRELHARGRAAWPTLHVPQDAFARFVTERLRDADRERGVAGLHAADLYLARACAGGQARALALFETLYRGDIHAVLARLRLAPHEISELEQRVRIRLFVDGEQRTCKIGEYEGRGTLQAWLRTLTVRVALNSFGARRETTVGSAEKLDPFVAASVMDSETSYFKRYYKQAFDDAFAEAVSSLESKERLVLTQYFFDGLTIDQLAALHGGHRTTHSRTVRRVCEQLLEQTKRQLGARLEMSDGVVESILQLLMSQLDVAREDLGEDGV